MHVEYCQKLSLDLLKWYLIFIFQFVNVVYQVGCFVDIDPSLHFWDKHHWIMVYNHFKHCLICLANFLEDLCLHVHQWYWPVVFFFYDIFVWCRYQGDAGNICKHFLPFYKLSFHFVYLIGQILHHYFTFSKYIYYPESLFQGRFLKSLFQVENFYNSFFPTVWLGLSRLPWICVLPC